MKPGVRRKTFVKLCAATLGSAAIPRRVFAQAQGYSVDGQYAWAGWGALRSLSFSATPERNKVLMIVATMDRNLVKPAIVQAPENAIRGSQLWAVAERTHATLAINGGFFQGNSFGYDGLLVVDGHEITKRNTQFDGAVVIDQEGALSLQIMDRLSDVYSAMQTGPFIVEPGGTMGMRSKTYDQFRRSFIAQRRETIVIGISSPLSLYQLAQICFQYPDAFGVDQFDAVLNLCGAETAAFYARTPQGDLREGGALNSPAVLVFRV